MHLPLIRAILFEPVGCLGEFSPEPFQAIAAHAFDRALPADATGSQAYWSVLEMMNGADRVALERSRALIDGHECRAVDRATVYEDVVPALGELKGLGLTLIVASSLSASALGRFVEKAALSHMFDAAWSRETAAGVKEAPLTAAIGQASLAPESVLYLADTAAGLDAARRAGVQPILMMNDPDEAMRLTAHKPAGGIVSLHELPDFVRLVSAEHLSGRPATATRSVGRAR